MFAQESLPPAIDEQATASQLCLSEVEMARTLRAAVSSESFFYTCQSIVQCAARGFRRDYRRSPRLSALGTCKPRGDVGGTRNLPARLCENSRCSSADQVGKLCRFGFRPQATKVNARPLSSDEPMKVVCKAQEQKDHNDEGETAGSRADVSRSPPIGITTTRRASKRISRNTLLRLH